MKSQAWVKRRQCAHVERLDEICELLSDLLGSANYSPQGTEVIKREQGALSLSQHWSGRLLIPVNFEEIVSRLDEHRAVESASWNLQKTD